MEGARDINTSAWMLVQFGMSATGSFAEPLADADEKARLEEGASSGAPILEYVAGCGGNRGVDRRFMPPMPWADVPTMYCLLPPSDISSGKASLRLLQWVYKELKCK